MPFLFTVKELVAKGEGSSFKPGFTWGGEFSVPSYRTGAGGGGMGCNVVGQSVRVLVVNDAEGMAYAGLCFGKVMEIDVDHRCMGMGVDEFGWYLGHG